MTNDGKPYGPWKYKKLVKECYWIAKYCNTPYTDVLQISPLERNYLLQFIEEDDRKNKEAIDKLKQKNDK